VLSRDDDGDQQGDRCSAKKESYAADQFASYVDTSTASIANQVHFDTKGTLMVGRLFATALAEFETVAAQP
jgi:hypothetical protein